MDDPHPAWVALAMVLAERPRSAWKLLKRHGSPEAVLRASPEELAAAGLRPDEAAEIASGHARERAARELERLRKRGATVLTFESAAFPAGLREVFDPPLALYVAGDPGALAGPAVGVVGARRPTAYGRAVAEKLAGDLARRGLVVVSGLARGIDATAHWGALREGGRTVAVLGSGLDTVYPRENRGLAAKIAAAGGAVMTEQPLGAEPAGFHFPLRNRLISGLSLGLVVVEAAERSGSLITAKLALEQGREVMAVPGPVTSPLCRGTHGLLRAGAAVVESWVDVAEALPAPWRDELLAEREEESRSRAAEADLSPQERRVRDLVPPDAEVLIDDLAEAAEISIAELLAVLLSLELKGLVAAGPGKTYRRRL